MIENCYQFAWQRRGQTHNQWGKDATGLIQYVINNQGFRSPVDYDSSPDWAFFGNSIVFGVGVPWHQILVSQFSNSQNYGLSGQYMNHHSVTNLKKFVDSPLFDPKTQIVFFWIDRDEKIESMIQEVNSIVPTVLHISSGQKRSGAINLMPHIDFDVSRTHAGPKTHAMWAKTIKLLINAR
jgi:hypothetical protein